MPLSISGTHSDFLNQLCELDDYPDDPDFGYLEKDFLSKMTAADWMSWLDKQDGRNKLSKFVKHARNKNSSYPIHYIKVCVIELSSNDYSRLTDAQWSSIPKKNKKVVQLVMTMPFPEVHDNKELEFKDINLEVIRTSLSSHIETATLLLSTLGFGVHESPQMLQYINLILEFITNLILDDIDLEKTLVPLHNEVLRRLYFILIHPDHWNNFKVETFIDYMTSDAWHRIPNTYNDYIYYEDFKIFVNSAESYLKKKPRKTIKQEDLLWNVVCDNVFINYFSSSHDASKYVSLLNSLLRDNPLFMDKMLKSTSIIRRETASSMVTWKKLANELINYNIFKDSEIGGHMATLIFQVIGVPCLDILASDVYVNSLSDDDKELLTLWTHACNLFQQPIPTVESIVTEKESKNIPDGTRKEWLRNRLHQIFIESPKTKSEHIFYRGIATHCSNLISESINPVAVSFDYNVANEFTQIGNEEESEPGCMLHITVPKYSNILAIDRVSIYAGDESEILLMPNSNLIDIKKRTKYSDEFNELHATYSVVVDEKNKFVGLPKPLFTQRKMRLEEFGYLILKTNLIYNTMDKMASIKILDELADYSHRDYKRISDALFKAIRTYQILYCGFGDVKLAIEEFWKLAFDVYANNNKIHLLQQLRTYCEAAWSTQKSLLRHNKASKFLDVLQQFVRPFLVEL